MSSVSTVFMAVMFVVQCVNGVISQPIASTQYISSPVANLVSEPVDYRSSAPVGAADAPKMLAQLIYNEAVLVAQTEGDWGRVSVPSLVVFSGGEYVPLCGWIKMDDLCKKSNLISCVEDISLVCIAPWTPVYKKVNSNPHKFQHIFALSYDTRLKGIKKEDEWWKVRLMNGEEAWVPSPCVSSDCSKDEQVLRTRIITHARQFLGGPYCWGGCSAPHASKKKSLVGFDCSGLIYRLFHVAGKSIPRNSRSQFAFASAREPSELQAGDVLFLSAPEISSHICHVMLYVGKGKVIEAWSARADNGSMNAQPIREISVEDKLGKPVDQIKNGEQVGRYICYGGTFF
jgi:hypothetical protein